MLIISVGLAAAQYPLSYTSTPDVQSNVGLTDYNETFKSPVDKIKVCNVEIGGVDSVNAVTMWSGTDTTGFLGRDASFAQCQEYSFAGDCIVSM